MAFFARPNLDNTQFKQLKGGEPLTLSGQTQIATTSGLTLIGDAGTGPAAYGGMYIPIIATGASNNFVLTYDGTQKAIVLKQSTSSGGTTVYPYSGLTTCTVGGITAGTSIYNDEVVDILQDILSPTVYPDLTSPSISSFTLNPSTTLYEVGTSISIIGTTVFNAGLIDPQYPPTACSCRSDGTRCYSFNVFGLPDVCCITNAPSYSNNLNPYIHTIGAGNNSISSTVHYCSGTQPYDSSGTAYDIPLPTGQTATCNKTICGTYPWYWGTVTCVAAAGVGRPDGDCIKHEITGGTATKVVDISSGTLNVTFGSTASDYIWFAIPSCGGVEKKCWYIDALNNQPITGPVSAGGCLFPAYNAGTDLITGVTSAQGCWNLTGPQDYEVYVSNYQSAAAVNMQLRNS